MRRRAQRAFESKTEEWQQVGLGEELSHSPGFYRGEVALILLMVIGVFVAVENREQLLPGSERWVQLAGAGILILLGLSLARALGRGFAPLMLRRLDPSTAGTLGFVLRLLVVSVVVIVALRVAGVNPAALVAGGAFTAVILGLAAQQTLSNFFAGLVLQGTRPFRVGQQVRIVSGMVAGELEGIVASLGLFYTTLLNGSERTMIPNSILLAAAVIPLRDPERVELRTRFGAQMLPAEIQAQVERRLRVTLARPIHVAVEEIDGEELIVRLTAVPSDSKDGPELAGEIVGALRELGVEPQRQRGED